MVRLAGRPRWEMTYGWYTIAGEVAVVGEGIQAGAGASLVTPCEVGRLESVSAIDC